MLEDIKLIFIYLNEEKIDINKNHVFLILRKCPVEAEIFKYSLNSEKHTYVLESKLPFVTLYV